MTRILGIDPGYERLGIAVIEKSASGKEALLNSDCFKTPKTEFFEQRLFSVGSEIDRVIQKYSVTAFAIENLFFNTNQKTALKVSEVRGALTYIALSHKLLFFEYTPLQIKNAITGYGRSDKKQIIDMLPHLIEIKKDIKHDDEYDAIAVALTCSASETF